jgi:uncharacterized protein DUF4932
VKRLALVALVACGSSSNSPTPGSVDPAKPTPPTPAEPSKKSTDVRVDKRIELMSIVMRLAAAEEYQRAAAMPYTRDVDETFKPFASHPAIAMTKEIRDKNGIGFDAPIHFAVHLDDKLQPFATEELIAFDERWKGVDIAGYAAKLRDFVTASKLDAFLAAHADYTKRVEEAFRTRVDAEDPVGWFDTMFGVRKSARYIVVPGLLNGPNNFGSHATTGSTLEMYQVLGVSDVDSAGIPKIDDTTVALLVHEMAHSYINPVFDQHLGAFEKARVVIYPLVEKAMRAQAYDSHAMINESGVRAVTVLYMSDRRGPQAAADATRAEVRRSFVWMPDLVELFRQYKKDRATYPDLEAFMPVVAKFFEQRAVDFANGLPPSPFLGPIDAVYYKPHVLVAPATTEAALTKYVEKIRDRFFADSPFVTASDKTLAETKGKGLIAYGTRQSNPVVAAFLDAAFIKFEPDKLVLGSKTFTGPGLVLIACRFRSDDPAHGMTVYAAARDADLVNVNSIRHGPQDWVVAQTTPKGWKVLASGDFPHAVDGAWLLP